MKGTTLNVKCVGVKYLEKDKDVYLAYCQTNSPLVGRFAVIGDIHGLTTAQEVFLLFCAQAGIDRIISLGDDVAVAEDVQPYINFSRFAVSKENNLFWGIRGNHHGVSREYWKYYGSEDHKYGERLWWKEEYPQFIQAEGHLFSHRGEIVDLLLQQGKLTPSPGFIWHGHWHQFAFSDKFSYCYEPRDGRIALDREEYYRIFSLESDRKIPYWISPGHQEPEWCRFAVFDGGKKEITMIQLKVTPYKEFVVPSHLQIK